jgi:hypothetical protein
MVATRSKRIRASGVRYGVLQRRILGRHTTAVQELYLGGPSYLLLFFLNRRRVSKDPDFASIISPTNNYREVPQKEGNEQNSLVKVQRRPWQKRKNAIRSYRRPPRRRRRSANSGRRVTIGEPATWGNTASRSRGSSEAIGAGALHPYGPAGRNGASRPMPPEKSS